MSKSKPVRFNTHLNENLIERIKRAMVAMGASYPPERPITHADAIRTLLDEALRARGVG